MGAIMRIFIWIAMCLFGAVVPPGNAAAEKISGADELLPVKVYRVAVDSSSQQPVVLLTDPAEERAMPVWIGPCEASALDAELEGTRSPRPLTHDLAASLVQKLDGKIQRVVITHRSQGIFFAQLIVEKGGVRLQVDARPSDSLVLALKSKAPIFVSRGLFGEASVSLREKKRAEALYGLVLQELTPPLAQSFSYPSNAGALIVEVLAGSQAEKDGLRRGDILAQLGDQGIRDVQSLRDVLREKRGPAPARVFRDGKYISLAVRLP